MTGDIETRSVTYPWDYGVRRCVPSAGELPACGLSGVRCKGGVSSSQALAWNRRTCRLDTNGQFQRTMFCPVAIQRENPKWQSPQGESTDARHWGGPTSSSDEGPVMGLEPRGRAVQDQPAVNPSGEEPTERSQLKVKPFVISKRLVYGAWEKVQANRGAPGVDAVSITEFKLDEVNNLCRLWNRMSSGSYFPGAVRGVEIPMDHGAGIRLLGVPNTADRIAQTAAAMLLEVALEPIFHRDSYGSSGSIRPQRTGCCSKALLEAELGARHRRPGLLRQRSP